MIGYMLHRLPAIHRPVDRQTDGGPTHSSLFRFLNTIKSNGYRLVSLRSYRILWIAAAPFYAAAMLINLIWACLWMPDLEPNADADSLGWESQSSSASQLNTQRADRLVASSTPSVN